MMNRKRYFVKDTWAGFPEDLKNLFVNAFFFEGKEKYVFPGVLQYVLDNKVQVENGWLDKKTYLLWVDRLFTDLLMPCKDEEVWREHLDSIGDLLFFAEELINQMESDAWKHNRTEEDLLRKESMVYIAQNLQVFFSLYALIKEDEKLLERSLSRVVEATKANITYVLNKDDAEVLLDMYGQSVILGFYYVPGNSFLDPLEWLSHEVSSYGDQPGYLIPAYDKYIAFLTKFPCAEEKRPFVDRLMGEGLDNKLSLAYDAKSAVDDEISLMEDELRELEEKSDYLDTIITTCNQHVSALRPNYDDYPDDDDCPF